VRDPKVRDFTPFAGTHTSGLASRAAARPVSHCINAVSIGRQTFSRVGVYLSTDVFSHGQLYIALSQVSNVENLLVVKPSERKGVVSVVHKRVFKKSAREVSHFITYG
jgi:hypothetical protein